MRIQTASLSCLLALAAGVPSVLGQVFVTATPLSFTPNSPSHQISLGLTISGTSSYNVAGVSFDLQLGGLNPTVQTVPTITSVAANSANFPVSVMSIATPTTQWLKSISIDWTATPLTGPISTPVEFAVVTVNAASFSTGSWPFTITSMTYDTLGVDGQGNPEVVTTSVQDFSGTFSAVPEPEETMAVMAGLSLGLGWWIRRRRGKGAQSGAPGGGTGQSSR